MREIWLLLGIWIVLEVDRKVGRIIVRCFGGASQEFATLKVPETKPDVHVPVEFVPSVGIELFAYVGARISFGVTHDCRAGCVVKRVGGAGEPDIQILAGNRPTMAGLDGQANALGLDILPAKLIGQCQNGRGQ